MPLTIDYRLVGSGWAECTVTSGEATCEISASYLSDALGNLVLAATAILAGAHSISVGFDEEPGEYRWVLEWSGSNQVKLRVLEFQELWSNRPDAEGQLLFQTEVHPLVFGEAVSSAAGRVFHKFGAAGYKKDWVQHEFPTRQLELLDQYIDSWRRNGG
ncbi:hypothetical protein [Ideonella paludis]|uniref:Uncharacterized protein n=1 Tax=Ideonella paludis TaxID=1233411 RepID=A0ABS5DT46_9BURK|nr:hypothetical protein [Ideonella paludis]MBQ0934308.1 hypothetical protein [Ideonella paludis]